MELTTVIINCTTQKRELGVGLNAGVHCTTLGLLSILPVVDLIGFERDQENISTLFLSESVSKPAHSPICF